MQLCGQCTDCKNAGKIETTSNDGKKTCKITAECFSSGVDVSTGCPPSLLNNRISGDNEIDLEGSVGKIQDGFDTGKSGPSLLELLMKSSITVTAPKDSLQTQDQVEDEEDPSMVTNTVDEDGFILGGGHSTLNQVINTQPPSFLTVTLTENEKTALLNQFNDLTSAPLEGMEVTKYTSVPLVLWDTLFEVSKKLEKEFGEKPRIDNIYYFQSANGITLTEPETGDIMYSEKDSGSWSIEYEAGGKNHKIVIVGNGDVYEYTMDPETGDVSSRKY